jgi:ubiquinone biosynthesis protein Coq4
MKVREKLCAWMFEKSKTPYAFIFKRKRIAWPYTSVELLRFPEGTLGKAVGEFLKKNKFELIPKLESHDVYHVLTDMDTTVKDEIAMQFLMIGNGKRSIYMFITIMLGFILLPEYISHYRTSYKRGKSLYPIYDLKLPDSLKESLHFLKIRIEKNNLLEQSILY